MSIDEVAEAQEVVNETKQYICFIKRRVGAKFIPYTLQETGEVVVKSLREFLDHELARWLDPAVFCKVTLLEFVKDIEVDPVNSQLAARFGWNYAEAVRLVESEQAVYMLMVHPRFQAIPYSFRRVKEDDDYALSLVKKIWSLRGGDIVFDVYDPEIHGPGSLPKQ